MANGDLRDVEARLDRAITQQREAALRLTEATGGALELILLVEQLNDLILDLIRERREHTSEPYRVKRAG